MSEPGSPEPASLVFGLLLSQGVDLEEVLSRVAEGFGSFRAVAPERPFAHSSYYEQEMGQGLRRFFAGVSSRVDSGALAAIKRKANALETLWAVDGRRRVNLDPGLLNLYQMVLASGKPAGHRIYLGRGVYAEVEYTFESGTFHCLPWTYPDYREPGAIEFFNELRETHRAERKSFGLQGTFKT